MIDRAAVTILVIHLFNFSFSLSSGSVFVCLTAVNILWESSWMTLL